MKTSRIKNTKSGWQDIKDLRKLWPYLKQDKKNVFIAIALIPIISVIQVIQPYLIKVAIDDGIIGGNTDNLINYSAIFLILVIGEYITRTTQAYTTAIAIYKMILSLRNKVISHVLTLKASYHDHSLSGALVTRATSDFDNLSESLSTGVVRSIVDMAILVGCVISMFLLEWRLAIVACVILPIAIWIITIFSKSLKKYTMISRRKIASLNAYTQECLYGNATIKLLTAKESANKKFQKLNYEFRSSQMKVVINDAFLFSILDGISSITIGFILWVSVTKLFGIDNLSAGLLVAFVRLAQQLFDPLKQLGSTMAMLQGVFTAVERIFSILGTKEFLDGDKDVPELKGRIEFKNTSFAYKKADKKLGEKVLKNISFVIEPGKSLALIGSTGSGKSTIIKLLSKLYDGYEGEVLIDGNSLKYLNAEQLIKQISIVPQDIVLFNGSINFNIGLDLDGVTNENIKNAAKIVGADKFINNLPGTYDFIVKERGTNLSHGQRQLITFARALAKQPKLVILDEATSSVDPESEAAIQGAIKNIFLNRSVIVIAHRLSTIKECDNILVINKGTISESGNHQQLIDLGGEYSKLQNALKKAT